MYIFINNLFMNLFHKLKCILRCVFAELINRFHEIPIKTKPASFENIDKLSLKFAWECKRPSIAKQSQERRKMLVDFYFLILILTMKS